MMKYELKNDYLKVQISSIGSELQSIKNQDGLEYVWQVDKKIWPRQAPILFPIVGRLNGDFYIMDDQKYQMTQHGFARDEEFQLVAKTNSKLVLRLLDNDFSHKIYPFKFELTVTYILNGPNISVSYVVKNRDKTKDLYFSIGAHPGFRVPTDRSLNYDDFSLNFSPNQERIRIPISGHSADVENKYPVSEQNFKLTRKSFKDDAIVYELDSSTDVILESDNSKNKVIFNTGNAKFVGLWSTYPAEGKFVCIEPWWGLADTPESNNQLVEKNAINKLEPESEFEAHYSIGIE